MISKVFFIELICISLSQIYNSYRVTKGGSAGGSQKLANQTRRTFEGTLKRFWLLKWEMVLLHWCFAIDIFFIYKIRIIVFTLILKSWLKSAKMIAAFLFIKCSRGVDVTSCTITYFLDSISRALTL